MKRRPYKGKRAVDGGALLSLLLGLALGVLSKWADFNSMLLADLTSGILLWILLSCAVARFSRTPLRAGLHVLLLLGGMVVSYYAAAYWISGVWATRYLVGWGLAALLSPVPAFAVWHAGGRSRRAWAISLGVLAFEVLAAVVYSGRLRILDAVMILLTAAVLLWDKVKVEKHVY